MHVAESARFYRPRSLVSVSRFDRSLPASVREAVQSFLERRAELLLGAPGLDRKTYCDRPPEDRLDKDEQRDEVLVAHFADDYWPHRWCAVGKVPNNDPHTVEGLVQQRLNQMVKALRDEGLREASDVVFAMLNQRYRGCHVNVLLRTRQPRNSYGVCVEDIEYRSLSGDLPEDVANFVAAAHNALIALLAWVDRDLAQRLQDHHHGEQLARREADTERKIEQLLAREKRHREAVKKVKVKLAQEKAAAANLMAAANQRMNEAMTMAALVQAKPQSDSASEQVAE